MERNLFDELAYAKKAVISCLEDARTLVDFKGLAYWAKRVEELRIEIEKAL